VTSGTSCAWTATSGATWITVVSGASGSGNGTVTFTVAANTGPARSGTLTITGQSFTVNQAGGCTFSIVPTSQSVGAGAGNGAPVAVTAGAGCGWTAVSNATWLTITAGASGSGNGTVTFSAAANSGLVRTGTLTIAGSTFTVTQATACTFSINSTSHSFDRHGGNFNINVTTGQSCPWPATTSDDWITITSGASGTGNGTVRISVPDVSPSILPRTGTVIIAGITFTVTQHN